MLTNVSKKEILLNSAYFMPHMIGYVCKTVFFNMNIAIRDFRNYVQYERAL